MSLDQKPSVASRPFVIARDEPHVAPGGQPVLLLEDVQDEVESLELALVLVRVADEEADWRWRGR